jgi:ring-1,2-phenylacetyl-CoA epoxidase subunit PaaC
MATTSITVVETPLLLGLLRRADDALVLGHRLSEWTGHAPTLEEELALANLALDLIGQARALYQYAGGLCGHDEDALAYLRDPGSYRNCLLVEQPNGDFACTMVRHVLFSAFIDPFWRAAVVSTDAMVAAIAAKAVKESAYHLRHAGEWLVRLGDGTEESHRRTQEAVDLLWPYTGELFEADTVERALIDDGVMPDAAALRDDWHRGVGAMLARATLRMPEDGWMQSGGRRGVHSEHLGHLLAELQVLPRTYPGAQW